MVVRGRARARVKDNIISESQRNGIWFTVASNYNIFANNSIFSSETLGWDGIGGGYGSKHNIIQQNEISNYWNGVHIEWTDYYGPASENMIIDNSISSCRWGFHLDRANNVTVANNTCFDNEVGMTLESAGFNKIISNTITRPSTQNTQIGILLRMGYAPANHTCGNNTISENLIENYGVGVHIEDADHCDNNSIYHNSFINYDIAVENYGSMNFWDDGYPSGGNYWSDYTGIDIYCGASQDQPGSDGIGDTQYVIDVDNVDHYPLMVPYGSSPSQIYNLTITMTAGGTTNPPPNTYQYASGSIVQVTAIPETYYLFDHWELNGSDVGSANPYSVWMDADYLLHAVFVPKSHDIAVTNITLSKTIIGESYSMTINITVSNQGDFTETFSVTISINQTKTVTLLQAVKQL